MNYSGFENENKIINALNNKYFIELNDNLKNMIKGSFKNYNSIIKATKEAGHNKSDLKIIIGDEIHTYSIKKGTGNSIHQEPIESFLEFLEKSYKIDETLKNDLRFFVWGDRTLDGKGKISDRLSAKQLSKLYPTKIANIQNFFDTIRYDLIKRFLIEGVYSRSYAEFVYYGTIEEGVCVKSEKIIDWLVNNKAKGVITIGRFTFQAWNRNINGGNKSEHKRGVVQIKWGTIKDDIKEIK